MNRYRKKLIMALALRGHGTSTLARAFRDCGFEGGHEVVGSGSYGSCTPVPNHQVNNLHNSDLNFGDIVGGYTGDNELSDLYKKWHWYKAEPTKELFTEALPIVDRALGYFLHVGSRDVFVDISHYLAEFWPVVRYLCEDNVSIVHLTKDPRTWVQKQMYEGAFTEREPHYGSVHTDEYRQIKLTDDYLSSCSNRIQSLCTYWDTCHRFFLACGSPIYHVEDFNSRGVSESVASTLVGCVPPGFTLQRDRYSQKDMTEDKYTTGPTPCPKFEEWDPTDQDTLISICGETADLLGYRLS